MRYFSVSSAGNSLVRVRDVTEDKPRNPLFNDASKRPDLPPLKIDPTQAEQELRNAFQQKVIQRPDSVVLCEVSESGDVRAWWVMVAD
jgi:hypothetical protein